MEVTPKQLNIIGTVDKYYSDNGEGLSRTEIAKKLGNAPGTIAQNLRKLKEAGELTYNKKKKLYLPDKGFQKLCEEHKKFVEEHKKVYTMIDNLVERSEKDFITTTISGPKLDLKNQEKIKKDFELFAKESVKTAITELKGKRLATYLSAPIMFVGIQGMGYLLFVLGLINFYLIAVACIYMTYKVFKEWLEELNTINKHIKKLEEE